MARESFDDFSKRGPPPLSCCRCCRPPPLSFLLKLCVIVLHTHRYHPPKSQPNPKHHDGGLIFSHFTRAACLLAAAAAKPGRSTLDTKEGYKTKTGSTSSVTLTLAITLTNGEAARLCRRRGGEVSPMQPLPAVFGEHKCGCDCTASASATCAALVQVPWTVCSTPGVLEHLCPHPCSVWRCGMSSNRRAAKL